MRTRRRTRAAGFGAAALLLLLAACRDEGEVREATWISAAPLWFEGAGGGAVAVPAGTWLVVAQGEESLLLAPERGDSVELRARPGTHDLAIETPEVVLEERDDGRTTLVLLLPDGKALEAQGGRREGMAELPATAPRPAWEYAAAYALDRLRGSPALEDGALLELEGELRDFREVVADADGLAADRAVSEEEMTAVLAARIELERARTKLPGTIADLVAGVRQASSEGFLRGLDSAGGSLRAKAERSRARVDEALVYLGDPRNHDRPALVDVDRIYSSIPEYVEVVRDGLEPSDPRYLMLLRVASRKFLHAVRVAARKKNHDLVGGLRAITPSEGVPHITDAALEALRD